MQLQTQQQERECLNWVQINEELSPELVRIIPINFNTHKQMLGNLPTVVSKGYLTIDPETFVKSLSNRLSKKR